jgi:hypothetical protein
MSALLVTYDLVGANATEDDYKELIAAIEAYADAVRVQRSVWLIRTDDDVKAVRNALREHLRSDDRLLLAELTGRASSRKPLCGKPRLKEVLAQGCAEASAPAAQASAGAGSVASREVSAAMVLSRASLNS